MAKVLLAWELGAGAGHCAKLVPLAAALVRHGHEISIAARELVTARQILGPTEAKFFQAPYLGVRATNAFAQTRTLAQILHNTGFGDSTTIEVLCRAWRNLFAAIGPDMIVCDHAPMALLASRGLGLRRVVIGTGFTVPPNLSPYPDLRYWLPSATSREELQKDENKVLRNVNEYLAREQLSEFNVLSDLYAQADASFLLTFRELDHYPQREDAEYWGTTFMVDGSTPEWPPGKRRVFAYLKPPTANWKLGDLLSFLRESRLSAVVYVPGGDPRWLKNFHSPNLRFASRRIDIRHAAKNCDMAILNGNAGSVAALLVAGVPQLNLPLFLEQLIASRRVADLGAGLYANPARPHQITARLIEVLDSERYSLGAQNFAQRYVNFEPEQSIERVTLRIHELLKC